MAAKASMIDIRTHKKYIKICTYMYVYVHIFIYTYICIYMNITCIL